jgi:hypothetical protein
MVVAIDAMAKRYGKLPSEILTSASTLDLVVLDAALTYENYLQEKSNRGGGTLTPPKVSDDELMRIWEQANGKNETGQK